MLLNLNIANMIKGKQHFKTIRFINTVCKSILLVLIASVMIENTSVIKDLNKIKETEKYWNVLMIITRLNLHLITKQNKV